MKLFESLDDLKPFIFRITDNGGATYDRITVTTCDGDAMLCTDGTICAHIESVDVQRDADDVEAGTARDLRWIDLDEGLRRRIIDSLNEGFADWIESAPAAASRDEARDWQGQWEGYGDERGKTPIYREGDAFRIRDDERHDYFYDPAADPGPFATFVEAARYMLPEDYDLCGPEYFTTVDLWDETGGPAPLWDCEGEPATPFEVQPWGIDRDTRPLCLPVIGEARDPEHAKEIGDQWRADNPEQAKLYQPAYINKVNRVVIRID